MRLTRPGLSSIKARYREDGALSRGALSFSPGDGDKSRGQLAVHAVPLERQVGGHVGFRLIARSARSRRAGTAIRLRNETSWRVSGARERERDRRAGRAGRAPAEGDGRRTIDPRGAGGARRVVWRGFCTRVTTGAGAGRNRKQRPNRAVAQCRRFSCGARPRAGAVRFRSPARSPSQQAFYEAPLFTDARFIVGSA